MTTTDHTRAGSPPTPQGEGAPAGAAPCPEPSSDRAGADPEPAPTGYLNSARARPEPAAAGQPAARRRWPRLALAAGVIVLLAMAPLLARTVLVNAGAVALLHAGAGGEAGAGWLAFAVGALDAAARLAPDDPSIARLRAQAEVRANRPAAALPFFEVAARAAPGDSALTWQAGLAAATAGRPEEAIAWWRRGGLGPRLAAEGGKAAAAGRYDEARAWYTYAGQVGPEQVDLALANAALLEREGQTEAARDAYRAVTVQFPGSAPAYLELARLLGLAGGSTEAQAVLEQCVDRSDEASGCLFSLGVGAQRAGDRDRAVAWLERFVALAPASGDGWSTLGQVYLEQGRCTDALMMFRRAEERASHPVWRWLGPRLLGQASVAMGRYPEAVAALSQALDVLTRQGGAPDQVAEVRAELDVARAQQAQASPPPPVLQCRD